MSTKIDKIESVFPDIDLSGCRNCKLVEEIVEDSIVRRNGKPTGNLSVWFITDDRMGIKDKEVEFLVWSRVGNRSSRIGQYRSKLESEDRPNCLKCRGLNPIKDGIIEISGNWVLDLSLREFKVKRQI